MEYNTIDLTDAANVLLHSQLRPLREVSHHSINYCY